MNTSVTTPNAELAKSCLPETSGRHIEIYLDHNATTPVLPCAAEAVMHHMQTCFGNPSSSHSTGIKAKVELEATASAGKTSYWRQ
ncbi:MAG: hypothetical protein U5L01_14505 [Rheinheimera sp.]|nr:hypothetical protein [Rheinheimera sp.]